MPACIEASAGLDAFEIKNRIMLTGDRRRAAEVIAREASHPEVEAELLPEQKLDRIRQLQAQGRHVAMIGDGINDAPALAAASVGIAVAGASDITAEAADVVYLPHSLERLPKLFEVSRKAVYTAWQNIFLFAGAVNAIAVVLCATGKLTPVGAAFTHQLSSFFVMMNSLRLLRVEKGGVDAHETRFSRLWTRTQIPHAWERIRHVTEKIDFGAFDFASGLNWLIDNRRRLVRPALYVVARWRSGVRSTPCAPKRPA